jgi:hypothetical protein
LVYDWNLNASQELSVNDKSGVVLLPLFSIIMADFQAEQLKEYDMEQYQKYDTEWLLSNLDTGGEVKNNTHTKLHLPDSK